MPGERTDVEALRHELEAANKRLDELVRRDPLTGLLNRRAMEEELQREGERSRRQGTSMVAMLIDLDDFQRLNDVHGYSTGDAILARVGETLRKAMRGTDRAARLRGDEFLGLFPDTRHAEAFVVAERVRERIASIALPGPGEVEISITASIGLLPLSAESPSIDEILERIHTAVHYSKLLGKNRVSVVAEVDDVPLPPQLDSVALRASRQAILRLSDLAPLGYEFLVRGTVSGMELPESLMQLTLEPKRLQALDLLCFQACAQAATGLARETRCHLNLFPATLQGAPTAQLVEVLRAAHPSAVWCVEISEQLFVGDPSALVRRVEALQSAGIRIAVDDVGCGRSSMEALIVLHPDVIKVDHRYVTGVGKAPAMRHWLQRLVAASKALGAEVVAEGIETEEDLKVCQDLGCDAGQGFLWGSPDP